MPNKVPDKTPIIVLKLSIFSLKLLREISLLIGISSTPNTAITIAINPMEVICSLKIIIPKKTA